MGPLAQLYAYLQQKKLEEDFPEAPPRPHMGLLEDESAFAPRKGVGPRPFRDPTQGGPSPPTRGRLAAMYGGRK